MGVDDVVERDLAEPEVERQAGVAEVVAQPLARPEQHLLDDVAGVHAASERAVETGVDHPPQRRPMPLPFPRSTANPSPPRQTATLSAPARPATPPRTEAQTAPPETPKPPVDTRSLGERLRALQQSRARH